MQEDATYSTRQHSSSPERQARYKATVNNNKRRVRHNAGKQSIFHLPNLVAKQHSRRNTLHENKTRDACSSDSETKSLSDESRPTASAGGLLARNPQPPTRPSLETLMSEIRQLGPPSEPQHHAAPPSLSPSERRVNRCSSFSGSISSSYSGSAPGSRAVLRGGLGTILRSFPGSPVHSLAPTNRISSECGRSHQSTRSSNYADVESLASKRSGKSNTNPVIPSIHSKTQQVASLIHKSRLPTDTELDPEHDRYICFGVLDDKTLWGCGQHFAHTGSLYDHFCNEGAACIKPLAAQFTLDDGLERYPNLPRTTDNDQDQPPAGHDQAGNRTGNDIQPRALSESEIREEAGPNQDTEPLPHSFNHVGTSEASRERPQPENAMAVPINATVNIHDAEAMNDLQITGINRRQLASSRNHLTSPPKLLQYLPIKGARDAFAPIMCRNKPLPQRSQTSQNTESSSTTQSNDETVVSRDNDIPDTNDKERTSRTTPSTTQEYSTTYAESGASSSKTKQNAAFHCLVCGTLTRALRIIRKCRRTIDLRGDIRGELKQLADALFRIKWTQQSCVKEAWRLSDPNALLQSRDEHNQHQRPGNDFHSYAQQLRAGDWFQYLDLSNALVCRVFMCRTYLDSMQHLIDDKTINASVQSTPLALAEKRYKVLTLRDRLSSSIRRLLTNLTTDLTLLTSSLSITTTSPKVDANHGRSHALESDVQEARVSDQLGSIEQQEQRRHGNQSHEPGQRKSSKYSRDHATIVGKQQETSTAIQNSRQGRVERLLKQQDDPLLAPLRSIQTPSYLPAGNFSPMVRAVNNIKSKLAARFRPLPLPGMQRLQWTCPCGANVQDDYVEVQKGALAVLQEQLNDLGRYVTPSQPSDADGVMSHLGSQQADAGTSGSLHGLALHNITTPMPATIQGQNLRPDDDNAVSPTTAATHSHRPRIRAMAMHLILCSPFSTLATNIQQPDTSDISSDQEFFQALSTHYHSLRGNLWRRLFSLRALVDVRFVQLELLNTQLAEIRKKDVIPPVERCSRKVPVQEDSDVYTYNPVPADIVPPIGKETLMHLMKHPHAAKGDTSVLFERVPRKLHHALTVCPQKGSSIGWGLQYVEGLSRARISFAVFLCCMASTAAGIVYTVKEHDVQGGFTIATYVLMLLASMISSAEALFNS